MSKHTPGAWNLQTVRTQVGVCHKIGPFPAKREGLPERHACLYADYPSNGNPADLELEANARLIAAAPELLDALERLQNCAYNIGGEHVTDWQQLIDAADFAQEAIAKARGK